MIWQFLDTFGTFAGMYLLLLIVDRQEQPISSRHKASMVILMISLIGAILSVAAYRAFIANGIGDMALLFFLGFMLLLFWFAVESYRDLTAMRIPISSMLVGTMVVLISVLILLFTSRNSSGFNTLMLSDALTFSPRVSLISGTLMTVVSALIVLGTRGKGLGTADIAFFFVMGAVNGFPGTLNALYISVFSALLYSTAIAIQKKKFQGVQIPFIPFLSLGTLIAFLLGNHALIGHFL